MKAIFMAVTIVLFGFFAVPAYAENCPVVYGGGEIDCGEPIENQTNQPTVTPTPTKAPANNQQSKGGLPIEAVSKTDTAPATGPELGLISLIPMAAAGWYLRRKTK